MHPSLIMMMNKFIHLSISSRMCLCNAGQFISKGRMGQNKEKSFSYESAIDVEEEETIVIALMFVSWIPRIVQNWPIAYGRVIGTRKK
jgi:hypothetical protein